MPLPSAQVVVLCPLPRSADLSEALDALELVGEVLTQSIGRRSPTRLQRTALAVVDGLRTKHKRSSPGAAAEQLRPRRARSAARPTGRGTRRQD
jgi:hypothetical protein